MILKVQVTEQDIRYGKRLNSKSCPVARAVRRALPSKFRRRLNVSDVSIAIDVGKEWPNYIWIDTPARVSDFIFNFDFKRRKVQPFTFQLKVPDAN